MKFLIALLVVAVAVMAEPEPERERRSVLGLPVLAPGVGLLGPAIGGAVIASPVPAIVAGPAGTIISKGGLPLSWGW